MRSLPLICALGLAAAAAGAMAQTPAAATAAAPAGPVAKTTCSEYLALDETFKPKFIYYATGLSKKGKETDVIDIEGIERVKPSLDEYCKVNLNKSAYEHVMKASMASEKRLHKK